MVDFLCCNKYPRRPRLAHPIDWWCRVTSYREAYIRVAIAGANARGQAKCVPVNSEHEAFDGTGFSPGYLVVDQAAIVPSPIERAIEPCLIMYGGQPLNQRPKSGSDAHEQTKPRDHHPPCCGFREKRQSQDD